LCDIEIYCSVMWHNRIPNRITTGSLVHRFEIHSAWRKANDRLLWRCIIDTVTLPHGVRPLKKNKKKSYLRYGWKLSSTIVHR